MLSRSSTILRQLPRHTPLILYRTMATAAEDIILTSRSQSNNVVILTLNRPKALNALSTPLFTRLNEELQKAEDDDSVRAIVLTGSEKAFAAGADIKEMKDKECESDNVIPSKQSFPLRSHGLRS